MKSTKTMVALLVASTLGLGGVAIAATQDHEGGDSRRQAATERTGEDRQRRSERREAADSEGRSERRQEQTAGNDNGVGDRGDRGDRSDRSDRQARAGDSGNDHGLGRREPQRARSDYRPDRRHSNNGRYTGHDRRSQTRHADRSHDRRKDRSYGIGGRGGFDNRVDRHLSKQQAQIRHGRHSGELSRGEHQRLQRDQSRIAHMDRRFGSDGRYTKVERRKLSNALDRASNRVYRARSNDRVASHSGGHKRNW